MTGQLDVIRDGHLGIIALNRPEAINALSLEMIDGITRALEQWRDDDGIRAVLFEGRGQRGFCSGGDVRAVRQAVIDGQPGGGDAFFAAEYAMNGLIARYHKPTVALVHGIVMGGGIGIAGHCTFRFATTEARFAMPEAAIGFFCDVGVNFILAKAPLHRALAFAMSGVPVGVADALTLGLTDCPIDPSRIDAVRAGIAAAADGPRVEAGLAALMQAEMVPTSDAVWCAAADRYARVDWGDVGEIMRVVGADAQFAPLQERSPTSLVAIAASHRAARGMADIADVLALDLRLARHLSRMPDFAEGVRAVLVDKDQRPQWQPRRLEEVDRATIAAIVAAA
ncbi:MAG: enoyl-CoA hydratase/isomerase family protein [Devosia sp.]|uniref:enoyl-CoA hydratase/isomerase family protein n=2 Tax=Devosia sp. TaxID=1871048 RepID=UPI001AC08EA3|nr:enoyl-CoA hydratase/isomerase family protein [Devosia sp.]MBN9314120.1 enoyl-CoA hydratase/isomerase family protein [Devosia sp.]